MPLPVTAKDLFDSEIGRLRPGPEAIRKRPKLAVYIAEIAAAWTKVEMGYALLLTKALGAHARAAIPMYLALIASPPQMAAMKAAIKDRLESEDFEEFEALVSDLRKASSGRNDVVHGCWAVSSQFPDDLILLDRAAIISTWALEIQAARGGSGPGPTVDAMYENAQRYREGDFKDILTRILGYHYKVDRFTVKVARHLAKLRGSPLR